MKAKKLIEVALPIKEISAESVRDKSIRHGHISTLHLWWARRPLPVCRAIVFASLVPDPLDDNCPEAFRDAVKSIIGKDSIDSIVRLEYKPYADIPYTAIYDPMEDNLRNRLMMFIGKFSDKCQQNMLQGKTTVPKEQLSDGSLIKWENKNNPRILRMARELIWVAYNSEKKPEVGYETLHKEFCQAFDAIKQAEQELYDIKDRHIASDEVKATESALQNAITQFQNQMPSVFDPFAGGGAIPLEAARLGCRSYGNDINPVAHIIERGSAEFPQKYGKPIVYSKDEFIRIYGEDGLKMANETERNITFDSQAQTYRIPNRFAFDVEFYVKQILKETEKEVGHLYPANDDGKKPIAYFWARTAQCSNPSCKADVPLMRQLYLVKKPKKEIYLKPIVEGNKIKFELANGKAPNGWVSRTSFTCPCCGSTTEMRQVKETYAKKHPHSVLLAVVEGNDDGKKYRLPTDKEKSIPLQTINEEFVPQGKMAAENTKNFSTDGWGYGTWKSLFTNRQLFMLTSLAKHIERTIRALPKSNYRNALQTMLAIWFDRVIMVNTSFGFWEAPLEKLQRLMGRQAIGMTFDYPESHTFCGCSGSALNQLAWLIRYLEEESSSSFASTFFNASSGERSQFEKKSISAVVTDPPYYNAIAYADCSDFFYGWLKLTIGDLYPLNFSTPQTPKTEECTALAHYHQGSVELAKRHFEKKLTQIFDAIETQTTDVVSIMYAHQSTEAWTTLCNSILGARMNITGSWPMDTEMMGALKTDKAFLESSVTVACRPSERKGFGEYREVKRDIEKKVAEEVEYLYELGFRGVDLLTACFGQAVSEFGRYKLVEKADGSEVSVGELLELARNSAFESLLKGVQGDDYTRFYIGWLQLNGVGDVDFDDATKFTRIGVNVDIKDIIDEGILIHEGTKMHIAMSREHLGGGEAKGSHPKDSLINQAHRAIILYRIGDRRLLLRFVRDIAPEASSPLWRLLATLKELLPAGEELKQVQGLLQNAEDLRQHCHEEYVPKQAEIDF